MLKNSKRFNYCLHTDHTAAHLLGKIFRLGYVINHILYKYIVIVYHS